MKVRQMSETKKRILEEMKKNPRVSHWQLSLILDLHNVTVEKHVRRLRDWGYVKRVGPNHRGQSNRHWEVLKDWKD